MNIIIVGCGKVGYTLVEQLSGEEHSLVVIDERAEQVKYITDDLDAMGIVGNGINYQTLTEAGISHADLLIAVTGSDEQNLLCCVIARKAGNCKTIARVRNPVYNSETEFLKKEFGLAMIINPEFAAANEISHIFQFPSAVKIDYFVKGHVELLHFRLGKSSPLINDRVVSIRTSMQSKVLVCTVTREDKVMIPNGDFIFHENDLVSILASRSEAISFFQKVKLVANPVENAMIAGGGKVSFYLAKLLLQTGIDTTIIEIDHERCEQLSELLPKATIIWGDATDQRLLAQEGLSRSQGFAALTGLDEENILLSLYAKGISKGKTITKVNRINFSSVINALDLDTVIYPRVITADYILRYVRTMGNNMNKRIESNVENLYTLEDGKAEALEFVIKENSALTDVPLQKLRIRKNILIGCIYRNGAVILPGGQDVIQINDSVIVVLSGYRISDIKEILED